MKNARTHRTIRRAGLKASFIGLPTGKQVRAIARLYRAEARLITIFGGKAWNRLAEGKTLKQAVKAAYAYA